MDRKTIMRKAISDALERLLERTDSLQEISVADILDECGLSRPTFYRYFSDKYDVVNWSYTYHVEELTGLYDEGGGVSDEALLRSFVQFFYDKRNFFCKIMDYVGQNSFYEHYYSRLVHWYTAVRDQPAQDAEVLSVEERYMLVYAAAGITQVLHKWLSEGCKESPEQIFQIIRQYTPDGVLQYTL